VSIGYRAEEPHLHGNPVVVLQFLPWEIVSVDHQMDVVFLNPGAVDDKGSVGKHFVNVATAGYDSDTLFHSEDWPALVGHKNVVRMDTHQEIVPQGTNLPQELNMAIVKEVTHHIYVYPRHCRSFLLVFLAILHATCYPARHVQR
jgi:hypothetical protein